MYIIIYYVMINIRLSLRIGYILVKFCDVGFKFLKNIKYLIF